MPRATQSPSHDRSPRSQHRLPPRHALARPDSQGFRFIYVVFARGVPVLCLHLLVRTVEQFGCPLAWLVSPRGIELPRKRFVVEVALQPLVASKVVVCGDYVEDEPSAVCKLCRGDALFRQM